MLVSLRRFLSSIHSRLLLVNLLVLLVPFAGIEFARLYERQLLHSLERDIRNQTTLFARAFEDLVQEDFQTAIPSNSHLQGFLERTARSTRTRIRILDAQGNTRLDSHRDGAPEGTERPASGWPSVASSDLAQTTDRNLSRRQASGPTWPSIADRPEVKRALAGHAAAYTRTRQRSPSTFLFLSEPIRRESEVVGVVYATRSTAPVLVELHRIRSGLFRLLAVTGGLTLVVALFLAWTITRPLARLSKAARNVARGDSRVKIPRDGPLEIREMAGSFDQMHRNLESRLHYIRDFAADVAHEFKSPLTSISGAVEILQEDSPAASATQKKFLSNIQVEAQRLDRLVSKLLVLSRIEASHEDAASFDALDALKRVQDRLSSEDQPVLVQCEPSALWGRTEDFERAVMNLVENALKHSPSGAPVSIDCMSNKNTFVLAVQDQGPGVPMHLRGRLFERFFSTDQERNGTGLGLAIVRAVAESHSGKAYLDETCQKGARFVMEIPFQPLAQRRSNR